MAGTARNRNANQIILGPSDVWLNVAIPTAGNRLTLDTDGTPDATANPNAIHLGLTESGSTFSYKPEVQDFTSDELTSPHLSRIISEACQIKGNLLQVFNWDLLAKLTVGGTKQVNTNTTTGYEELIFGGLSAVTYFPVAIIGPDIDGTGQVYVIQLYKTYNKAGLDFPITRKDQSKTPYEFNGLAIGSRAIGDQIGNFWHQLAANV